MLLILCTLNLRERRNATFYYTGRVHAQTERPPHRCKLCVEMASWGFVTVLALMMTVATGAAAAPDSCADGILASADVPLC